MNRPFPCGVRKGVPGKPGPPGLLQYRLGLHPPGEGLEAGRLLLHAVGDAGHLQVGLGHPVHAPGTPVGLLLLPGLLQELRLALSLVLPLEALPDGPGAGVLQVVLGRLEGQLGLGVGGDGGDEGLGSLPKGFSVYPFTS